MVENSTLRKYAAISDCNSQSILLRMPFELAATMLMNCPDCKEKAELMKYVEYAAGRSKKFAEALKEKK